LVGVHFNCKCYDCSGDVATGDGVWSKCIAYILCV